MKSGGAATLAGLRAGPDAAHGLIAPLGPHAGHTDYPRRLGRGRSIGPRLEQPGARWRVRRVERMAALCCLDYSNRWDACGKEATA